MTAGQPEAAPQDAPTTAAEARTGRRLTGALALAAAVLLMSLPWQAAVPKGTDPLAQGWWSHPAVFPGVTLTLILIFASLLHLKLRRQAGEGAGQSLAVQFEFGAYFICFIFLMGLVGFGLSMLIFSTLGLWRSGFALWRSALYAAILTAILVVLFRLVLTIWFPPSLLSSLMPATIGNFLEIYF
jgi:hypothetical protein